MGEQKDVLSQAQEPQQQEIGRSSDSEPDNAKPLAPIAVRNAIEIDGAGKNSEKGEKSPSRKLLTWEALGGICAVAALLFGGYGLVLTRQSNEITRASFEESKRATRVRERPWSVFDSIAVQGLPNVAGAEVSVGAILKNVGELPAQQFRMRVSAMWLGTNETFPDSPRDLVRSGETETSVQKRFSTSVLGPDQSTRVWAGTTAPLLFADLIGPKARSDVLYMYGHLEYQGPDAGAGSYQTTFCVTIHSDGSYLTCLKYNSIK